MERTPQKPLLLELGLLLCLLAGIALCAFHPLYEVDFFWHLELGKVISETRHIPRTDLFSSAEPGRPYVQFNWLWEVLAAQVVRAFGLHGVRIAQALLIAGCYALLYARARRAFRGALLAFPFVALAFVLFEDRFQARPAALVLGFFAALLPLLLGGYRQATARTFAGVFVLGVLWANLHGGETLLLLVSMGALLAGELCVRVLWPERPSHVAQAALLLAVSMLSILASPTAVPGLLAWAHAIGPQIATGNEEWLPSYTMLRNGIRPAFVLIGLGPTLVLAAYAAEQVARVRKLGRAAIDPGEWILCAGYLVLAHQAVRNAFLCLLPIAFMLQRFARTAQAGNGAQVGGTAQAGNGAQRPRVLAVALAAALGLSAIALEDSLPYAYGGFARIPAVMREDLSPDAFPILSARFMREAGIEGGIANDGHWGGYLIWQLWPACGVFADTRHHLTPEMWPVFKASHSLMQRPRALQAAHARWGIELAVFPAPTFALLVPPPEWRLLYKAGPEEVYQHVAGKHAERNLQRTVAWLRRSGSPIAAEARGSDLAARATELGAQRFFDLPNTHARMQQAARDAQSADRITRGAGQLDRGALLYQAGLYREAVPALEAAVPLLGRDTRPSYYAAFSYFALGMPARAREHLARVLAQGPSGNALKQARLAALARALASNTESAAAH